MTRNVPFLAGALALPALLVSCSEPEGSLRETGDFVHRTDGTLRMNQLQALATHNSYHIRLEPTDLPDWQYEHAPLGEQLAEQGVRGVEIDVHWNADTQRYDVLHIPLLDEGTTCATLDACLREVRAFSDANPGHHPLFVQIELKWPNVANLTAEHLDALDAEIRAVFPPDLLVTPAMVQGSRATLAEAVTTDGWPTLGAARGRTMFMFDCEREACLAYAGTNGALTGRVIFPDSEPSDPFAAVMVHNSPDATATDLVQQGYIVRVFADGIADVLAGNDDLDAALASGAQILSTDVPVMRQDVSYVADIPGGTPSRCNPVDAPVGCLATDVEDPALLRGR